MSWHNLKRAKLVRQICKVHILHYMRKLQCSLLLCAQVVGTYIASLYLFLYMLVEVI